ncbi:hypothetical protein PVOR_30623 [Paenibacillus vortex V453]|jgi:hypothetical protein|uniref:DUF5105 domain-containing protein n=3 Tax=Paenibacillus TaxID=44249 RepID=A0A163HJU3_9BACL|nr:MULTISPECIES: hypothetical protein [Paenibacillus]EFU38447.1 hypothetical protein PVOR_30623 [Paenibacillus vortex V453]ANA79575.1 hypothetical protein A3958_06080 [Paenibacillus glucanolyticus]ETT31253.1 hypothetical protein C169_25458 [Paenibacillus sp. FSL R5-808]KZS45520.1 hypothetical protein AWU65_06080 [Paenibacillus glucanolyticus]MDH6673910.1 hypothetical protein [Paenibacillus sp. LBL]
MRQNMKSLLLSLLAALSVLALSACSESALSDPEKEQIVKQVEQLETAEYKLLHFQMDYPKYQAELDGIVSDSYRDVISDRIIFGYNEKEYRAADLMGMPKEEYEKHKEHMLGLIHSMGMDEEKAVLRVSEPYGSEGADGVYVYVSESRELKERLLSQTNRRYSLDNASGSWTITNVDQDKVTIGSDERDDEAEAKLNGLEYQTHDGVKIVYRDKALAFDGWK